MWCMWIMTYFSTDFLNFQIKVVYQLLWLILRVNLTRLRNALIAGKTLFVDVFVRMFQEDIGIWIGRLGKVWCLHQCGWESSNPLRAQIEQKGEGRMNSLSLLERGHPFSLALRHQLSWVLSSWTQTELNHWLSELSSLQMGLLGFHNHMSQFL